VEQRDEEIRRIVESIAELQSIFADLANLVADQGTVLDRIDYNMEQTVVKVN
jgi:syntaxin 16